MGTKSSPITTSMIENGEELHRLGKKQEEVRMEINTLNKKLRTSPKVIEQPGDSTLSDLRDLYSKVKELAEAEVRASGTLLSELNTIVPSQSPGQERKRMEGEQKRKLKPQLDVPRVSPTLRNQLDTCAIIKGDQEELEQRTEKEMSVLKPK